MEQWIWILIFVLTLMIEVATAGTLVSIWFSIGALIAYGAYLIGLDLALQVIIFLVISIGAILAIRPIASRYFRGNTVATNADRIIGQKAVLTKAITPKHWGELNVYGVVWSAVDKDNNYLEVGTEVLVIAIEGAKLIVKKVD